MAGHHQEQLYESTDPYTNYWQNLRRLNMIRVVNKICQKHLVRSLLDIGCAEGLFVREFSPILARVVGGDISIPKLRRAVETDHGDFCALSALELPFEDESFDLVLTMDTLRYVPDPETAIREMARVSKEFVVIETDTASSTILGRANAIIRRVKLNELRPHHSSFQDTYKGMLWYLSVPNLKKLLSRLRGVGLKEKEIVAVHPSYFASSKVGIEHLPFPVMRAVDKLGSLYPVNQLGKHTIFVLEKRPAAAKLPPRRV